MSTIGRNFLLMKPVEGGWLYRMPSPWLFGGRHYLLTEGQRACLLAMAGPPRSLGTTVLLLASAATATAAVIAGAAILLAKAGLSPLAGGLIVGGLVLLVAYGGGVLAARRAIQRIRAAIPDLAPTTARLTNRDMREAVDATIGPGLRLLLAASSGFASLCAAVNLALALSLRAGPIAAWRWLMPLAGTLIFGALAIDHLRKWRRARRAPHSPAVDGDPGSASR